MVKTQIVNAILFCSKYSKESVQCMEYINKKDLPIHAISLDNRKLREAVLRGNMFQIKSVPTMLIEYASGDIQLFAGRHKIVNWIDQMVNNMQATEEQTNKEETEEFPQEAIQETEIGIIDDYDTPTEIADDDNSTSGLLIQNDKAKKSKSDTRKKAEEMMKVRENILNTNVNVPRN